MNCAYYNENDPKTAAWLEELIKAGHIASGVVDSRSIEDVTPGDVRGFTQCHFFAGIGGWSYALRMAGWSDSRPVWTGSCPCQPFSQAGKGEGVADERHLWPAFLHLIEHAGIPVVFGEQVASKAGLIWLRAVQTDMEARGFTFGAADLSAAGVGAPHIRQRLYWVGHPIGARLAKQPRKPATLRQSCRAPTWETSERTGAADGQHRPIEPGLKPVADGIPGRVGLLRGYGNAIVPQVAAAFIQACVE